MNLTTAETCARTRLEATKPSVYRKCLAFAGKLERGEAVPLIQLQYDYRCNMGCRHCSVTRLRRISSARSRLYPSDVRRLYDQAHALGLAHTAITGGEPLLFPDLDRLIEAVGPERFHIQVDTNGWLMDDEAARRIKALGVDKVQISLDSMSPREHDAFRRRPGAWLRAQQAIASVLDAGMSAQVATVVTRERARSSEVEQFVTAIVKTGATVSYLWPKLAGEWAGRHELLPEPSDVARMRALEEAYPGRVYTHTTPGYGLDLGCIAVKRIISVTRWGDVLPCPWMMWALGNTFREPLEKILARGMRYYGARSAVCRVSEDVGFIESRVSGLAQGPELPTVEEVMGAMS